MKSLASIQLGQFLAAVCLSAAALLPLAGCGGGGATADGRVPVEGTVTLDGTPIGRGSIELHPQSTDGLMSGGTISDGKFTIAAAQGPKPGTYQVRIFASEDTASVDTEAAPGDSSATPVAKERVAAKYNTQSELEVEIPAGGTKELKFEVMSK